MKRIKDEKYIFDIIEAMGETLDGSIHIIDQSDEFKVEEAEGEFRIYHSDGYCFDVKKEYACDPKDISQYDGVNNDGYYYSFTQNWDGFNNDLDLKSAIKLIEKSTHLPVDK